MSEEMPTPGKSLIPMHASDIRSPKLCTKSILRIACTLCTSGKSTIHCQCDYLEIALLYFQTLGNSDTDNVSFLVFLLTFCVLNSSIYPSLPPSLIWEKAVRVKTFQNLSRKKPESLTFKLQVRKVRLKRTHPSSE